MGQTWTVAPERPVLLGKFSALPDSVIGPVWLRMSVVAGAEPVKNLYISANDTGEVAHCTWVESGMLTFVAPVIDLPGGDSGPRVAHRASVRTPPGGELAVWPSMFTYSATFAARDGLLLR